VTRRMLLSLLACLMVMVGFPSFGGVPAASAAEPVNLLGNGSFEQVNTATPPTPAFPWGTYTKDGSPVVSMDTTDYITGGKSVKIVADPGDRAQVVQYVHNIEAGKSYKFSAWIKTQGVSSSQGARIQLYFLDENDTPMTTRPTNTLVDVGKLKGDNDWTYKDAIMTAPEGAVTLAVFNMPDVQSGTTTGTTWFDEEAVVMVDPLAYYEGVHPRLLLDADRLTQLRAAIQIGGTHAALWTQFKARLAPILSQTPPPYHTNSDLSENWQIAGAGNAVNFALAYLLEPNATQKQTYLDAATSWALASVGYPTWGRCADSDPDGDCVDRNTDLSAGEQLSAISLVYDWLYDSLSVTDRNTIEQVLYDRANEMYLKDSGQAFNGQTYNVLWPSMYLFNHMYISISGLATAGLALYDSHPDAASWLSFAKRIFDKTNLFLQPDGASQEGMAYWQSGTDYLLRYAALSKKFLGVNMFTNPYFKNNIMFAIYLTLPENSWTRDLTTVNLGDTNGASSDGYDYQLRLLAGEMNDGYAQWLANRMDSAGVMSYDKTDGTGLKYDFLNLLWYDPSVTKTPISGLPTLRHFNDLDIVSARSDWSGDESLIAFKSGPPMGHHVNEVKDVTNDWGSGHIHPDANHFSVFGEGEWLVRDDGYADKWTSNHNTLLVGNTGQLGEGNRWFDIVPAESAKMNPQITKAESHADFDFMIGDAVDAYSDNLGLTKYKRYLIYIKPDILIVADDIATDASQAAKNLELRFHPEFTNPALLADGSYYTVGNHSILRFKELTPGAAVATSAEAVSYNSDLYKGSRMAYRVVNSTEKNWKNAVAFTWSERGAVPANVKLTQDGDVWTFEAGDKAVSLDFSQDTAVAATPEGSVNVMNDATLDAIYVDGKPISGFSSSTTLYTMAKSLKKKEAPSIFPVKHDAGATVATTWNGNPDGIGVWTIDVTAENGIVTKQYRVEIQKSSLIQATQATAYGTIGDSASPNWTADDNLSTYWTAKQDNPSGDPWLKFDLGATLTFSRADIAWYLGAERSYSFDIEYSLDGSTWSDAFSGASSGSASGFETYDFPDVQARYVRILGHGNIINGTTSNPYTTITEVNLHEAGDSSAPVWTDGHLEASNSAQGLTLAWNGASDDVGVSGYRIYQNGVFIDAVPANTPTYPVSGLTNGQTYTFKVEATDAAGNESTNGPSLNLVYQTPTVVTLKDSQGNPISGGTVSYYDGGGWKDFGVTDASGAASKALPVKTYTFKIVYEGMSNQKSQDIGANPTVAFQTVHVTIHLKDSAGNPLDVGTVECYSNAWRTLGNTTTGEVSKELLSGQYTFKMTYEGTYNQKSQNIGTNPTVAFQTVHVSVQLIDSGGNPLDGGTAEYYANGWRTLGSTTAGKADKELLGGAYTFKMTYGGAYNQKQQDIGANPVVNFQF